MSDIIDPSKLKVAELRTELQERGLDTRGNKPVLIERLREALEAEANEEVAEEAHQEEEEEEEQSAEPEIDQENEEPEREEPQEEEPQEEEPLEEEEPPQEANIRDHSPQKRREPSPRREEACHREREYESQQRWPVKSEYNGGDVGIKEDPDIPKTGFEEAPMEDVLDLKAEDDGFADIKEEDIDVKQEYVEPKQEYEEERRGEKRRLSRSRSPEAKKLKPDIVEVRIENEPEVDKDSVLLDWYDSDLSLIINKEDFLSAYPLTMQGFAYIWHGVRATYGFTYGRLYYEVKVEDQLPVPHLEESEQHPHVLRVGWSVSEVGLTLGEDPFSYGYGGTGKASTNLKFKDYGRTFGKGDVLGCYLDLTAEPIIMSFTVNGDHQGICYEIPHGQLQGRALFPHIVTKNTSFRVNFGTEKPLFEPLPGYEPCGLVPIDQCVLGVQGPAKREEGEIIMMVGLPGAGKTTWVDKYCSEHPERKYNILGTNALIDKMKVNGLPRKRNYHGRWEVLIDRCTKCLNKLLDMAYKRRRNFIIDQTNVYPSAQRRKMKGFAGFKRRAVVICPTDEDLKIRTEKREREEGKDIPDKAVLEMKANFKLPDEGDLFDVVEFVEVQREEATKLVEVYNKEGEDAGFGQKKGFRGGFGDRRGGFMDRRGTYGSRGSGGGGGNFRGGWDRDRRGGYNDRRDRGGGGWNRDRADSRDYNNRDYNNRDYNNRDYNSRGSYNKDSRGGYNRDSFNRDTRVASYNRDNRGTGTNTYNRDRGGRGNYQNNWNRSSSTIEIKTTPSSTSNPWANQQGTQGNQSYGNYGNYNNQGWGSNQNWSGQQSYPQNYGNNWNQQYYQQQYWGQNYGYGTNQQSYNTTGTTGHNTTSNTGWGTPGTTQQQWGTSNYGGYQNQYQRR